MSSSEEKLTDDEILAAHKILPLCGQPRLTMMTMKSNYFESVFGCRKDGDRPGGGRGIAVFTSGGDSQGMNAAVRAVVR